MISSASSSRHQRRRLLLCFLLNLIFPFDERPQLDSGSWWQQPEPPFSPDLLRKQWRCDSSEFQSECCGGVVVVEEEEEQEVLAGW